MPAASRTACFTTARSTPVAGNRVTLTASLFGADALHGSAADPIARTCSMAASGSTGKVDARRPASLAALSNDVRTVKPHRLAEVAVELTWFEGELVYGGLN